MAISSQPLRDFLAAQKAVEELKPAVGSTLRAMRLDAGLSQAYVAAHAGVTQAFVSQVENEAKTPSSGSLERIINVMEGATSASSQVEDEENSQGNNRPKRRVRARHVGVDGPHP